MHTQRFLLIDGLRGIAAMMVVIFHLHEAAGYVVQDLAPTWLDSILSRGFLGVDVFFVISGFVIAYSVRHGPYTPSFLLRFGVRRSIRLDPPYWMTIGLEISLIYLGLMLFPGLDTPIPSVETVVAHLFYLQEILGKGHIIVIFWTLCYEVQFYLVLVGGLVALSSLARWRLGSLERHIPQVGLVMGGILAIYSMSIAFGLMPHPFPGLFIGRWYQFFLGVATLVVIRVRRHEWALVVGWLVLLTLALLTGRHLFNALIVVVTSGLILVASKRSALSSWLSASPLQFLGKVSYSLYLIHSVIGWRTVRLLQELGPSEVAVWLAWIYFFVGVGTSIFSAWLMWRLIEAPSHLLSRRIKLRPSNAGQIVLQRNIP